MAIEVAKFVPFHSGLVVGVYLVQHEGHLAYAFLDETNVGANETTDDTVVIFGTHDKRVRSVFLGTVLWGPQLPNFQSTDKYILNSETIDNHGMLCALDDIFDFTKAIERLCPAMVQLSMIYNTLNFFEYNPIFKIVFAKILDLAILSLEKFHKENIEMGELNKFDTTSVEQEYQQNGAKVEAQKFEYRTVPSVSEPTPTAST